MVISVAIQHHPSRAELVERLRASFPTAELVVDPFPDQEPTVNPLRTYRHALARTPPDADWRVILQDDLVACTGAWDVLPSILARHPGTLVSLYQGMVPQANAITTVRAWEQGQRYAVIPPNGSWCPVMALCWPAALVDVFTDWCLNQRRLGTGDDEIVGRWRNQWREDLVVTLPNLVEHPDDVVSLIGSRQAPHRHSCAWVEGFDATSVDW